MNKKLKRQNKKRRDLERILQEKIEQNVHIIAGEVCEVCIYFYRCNSHKKKTIGRCDDWNKPISYPKISITGT